MSTYVQHLNRVKGMDQGMEILSRASYLGDPNWFFEESYKETNWSAEENKKFETALAMFYKDTPDRWYNVAAMIPGKSVNDVIKHYRELEEDVSDIEAGLIPVPGYANDSFTLEWMMKSQDFDGVKQFCVPYGKRSISARSSDQERKKGVPWTEEEHRQFLLGLKKYGKGDWRNISRNFVTSRTPTQVASHAQKYFIRQLSGGKDKRRSSIHDITTVNPIDAKSTSTENDRKRTLQHSTMHDRHKELQGWNLSNQGSIMDFNRPNHSQQTAPVRETFAQRPSMQDFNLQKVILQGPQFGYYDSVIQMQQMQQI